MPVAYCLADLRGPGSHRGDDPTAAAAANLRSCDIGIGRCRCGSHLVTCKTKLRPPRTVGSTCWSAYAHRRCFHAGVGCCRRRAVVSDVSEFFVGTLPAAAARSFGALLFIAGMVLVGLSAVPYILTRRLSLLLARRALAADDRKEVLFLRSWGDDYFRMRARRASRHALLERLSFGRWDRFEEIVVGEVRKRGPVVAFAEPGTLLPPLGAVREVQAEHKWQQAVKEHIDESVLVIMTVDRTESVVWEMQQIAQQRALYKTVFLFSPIENEDRACREYVLCWCLAYLWANSQRLDPVGDRC